MHFITFPVSSTNIFPLANSKKGGQDLSEFNIKSINSVATDPNVTYSIGPSYVHSMQDFEVSLLSGMDAPTYSDKNTYAIGDYVTYGDVTYVCIYPVETPEAFNKSKWNKIALSTSILQISSGKAVVNGHYFESLAPVTIDLTLANAQLKQASQPALSGELSIGLKSYFSTEPTMAGSMLVENDENMYLGVQIVILPRDEFITPSQSPTNRNAVTADVKLADFVYINGSVASASIKQSEDKVSFLPAERIGNFENVLSNNYISKSTLDPNKLYVFSGLNGSDDNNGWCQAIDSLMIWDKNPIGTDTQPPVETEALFAIDSNEQVHLRIPHKQIHRTNTAGENLYYRTKDLALPVANYALGTPGTVTSEYTKKIKEVSETINTYKQLTNGKQIRYFDELTVDNRAEVFGSINLDEVNVGDYIVIRQDYTLSSSEGNAPSTMYVVCPPFVGAIEFCGTDKPSGILIDSAGVMWEGDGTNVPTAESPTDEELRNEFDYTQRQADINDYFVWDYHNITDDVITPYYWKVVSTAGAKTWSDAIALTGTIPYASVNAIGGFKNVDTTATDQGYVYRDENGRLRLLDYDLLRTGTLAYQFGEDYTIPAGMSAESIQEYLDEYVNNRVAFPYTNVIGSVPNMINLYISLPQVENITSINIYNIDSRFGTGVYIHLLGAATSNLVVNIIDCEKVRIDPNIDTSAGTPTINVIRSNLYYDASVIRYIRSCDVNHIRSSAFTGMLDISLWYDKFTDTDPDLLVNGMEVSQPNVPMTSEDIDFWSEEISNDNHYGVALRSVTFDGKGDIVSCSLYVSNNTTVTNTFAPSIVGSEFKLPQGSDLNYPEECITHALKVTGTFTTAYFSTGDNKWVVSETNFTALSGIYSESSGVSDGTISFYTKPAMIDPTYTNVTTIDGWTPGTYHIFYGGTTV